MSDVNYLFNNGAKVLDNINNICYASIFQEGCPIGSKELVLYQPTLIFSEDQVKSFINEINEIGFPCEYIGQNYNKYTDYINNNYYVFIIDLDKCKNKQHLLCIITLLRYMFEEFIGANFAKYYFNVVEKYPELTALDKIILASNCINRGTAHNLHSQGNMIFFDKEELFERIYKYKGTIFSKESGNLHKIWQTTHKIKRYDNDTLEQIYEKMKNYNDTYKVYIVGHSIGYANWLPKHEITNNIEQADLVLFTGGEDIDPKMYGEPKGVNTYSNPKRDLEEKEIYNKAIFNNIKILGICRGAQLVCVLNNGRLVQHQMNPEYIHEIETENYGKLKITSTHHQAAYPYNLPKFRYKILAWTKGISDIHLDGNGNELSPEKECEIVYYPSSNCLGIQGHPEVRDYQNDYPESIAKIKEIFQDFIENKL